MCFPKKQNLPAASPPPEKPPEPAEVGSARKAEDQALFGGVPNLRTDRSTVGQGAVEQTRPTMM